MLVFVLGSIVLIGWFNFGCGWVMVMFCCESVLLIYGSIWLVCVIVLVCCCSLVMFRWLSRLSIWCWFCEWFSLFKVLFICM